MLSVLACPDRALHLRNLVPLLARVVVVIDPLAVAGRILSTDCRLPGRERRARRVPWCDLRHCYLLSVSRYGSPARCGPRSSRRGAQSRRGFESAHGAAASKAAEAASTVRSPWRRPTI